jgi:hypothetical protein
MVAFWIIVSIFSKFLVYAWIQILFIILKNNWIFSTELYHNYEILIQFCYEILMMSEKNRKFMNLFVSNGP